MATTKPRSALTHPLEPIALALFKHRPMQDRTTLAMGFADPDPDCATFITPGPDAPKLGISPNRAYLVVAEDVLGWMHSQGKLTRDEHGWYHLAT